jgi:hypothetical protein
MLRIRSKDCVAVLVTGLAFAKGNGPILVGANPNHPGSGCGNRETTLRSGDLPGQIALWRTA